MACVGAAAKDYLITTMQFVLKATANEKTLMSVDDAIAKRRLLESYCKQFAACLSSNVADISTRETVLRGTFASFLSDEEKSEHAHQTGATIWALPASGSRDHQRHDRNHQHKKHVAAVAAQQRSNVSIEAKRKVTFCDDVG
jgi:hypothetical protein